MSDRLRRTSDDYDRDIVAIELSITSLETQLAAAHKNLADVKEAKAKIDSLLSSSSESSPPISQP